RLPFNVSVAGLDAATAAVGDEAHQQASRDLVQTWRPRLTQAIRGFGFEVLPSAGNFVLVLFKDEKRTAAAANDYLNAKGIIVRPVGGYGLPNGLRITIGTEDQNRAVIDALSEFAASWFGGTLTPGLSGSTSAGRWTPSRCGSPARP